MHKSGSKMKRKKTRGNLSPLTDYSNGSTCSDRQVTFLLTFHDEFLAGNRMSLAELPVVRRQRIIQSERELSTVPDE